MLKIFLLVLFISVLIFADPVNAQQQSFISIVNPVRGGDFWEEKNQNPETAVFGQIEILKQFTLQATWLIRFDALSNQKVVKSLNNLPYHEKGLFLEVTPSWTKEANVKYHQSESWHFAGSAFLTGYEIEDREKLIDAAFEKFKQVFNFYPKSVGAWWIDSYSLDYMQKKYGITSALIVSDQYTTDNYQIWGQYFSTPYYPSKRNALHPAQSIENKIPVVITQWAARDPVNAYGKGVEESTYSIQANDYSDHHNLDINYFSKLVDIYTKQPFNMFGHLVVGLENSYDWQKYGGEYRKQIETLVGKSSSGQFSIVTMQDFAKWYRDNFPGVSSEHIIETSDPLGTKKRVVWFMNPYYRVGWFFNQDGSLIKDIRQYVEGEEELCFQKRCDEVNFASLATRVLDEVTFGHKIVLDKGEISNFDFKRDGEKYILSYTNAAGRERILEFLSRDLSIDGKVSSIDTIILEATKGELDQKKESSSFEIGSFKWSIQNVTLNIFKFIAFLLIGCFTPGFILIKRLFADINYYQKAFLSITFGLVLITLLFYLLSLFAIKQFIFIYLFINFLLLIKNFKQIFKTPLLKLKTKFDLVILGVILAGTLFQVMPTFKSGLIYSYGLGLWGPNTHDGIWHISLINQLIKSVPPQNPIFSGEILKNYHYFYDLLVAATSYILNIRVIDLVFRFYPTVFSLLLGLGSFYLIKVFFSKRFNLQFKIATFFGLYLVYFAGSFGWIVEYIRGKSLSGESAFWANQSISFNLNPPFAISLLIIIAILLLLSEITKLNKTSLFILTMLCGSLIAFKAYAGVLILISLLSVSLIKRSLKHLLVFLTSSLLSVALFLSNFKVDGSLMIFAPFWFIHSMVDSPDRLGWARLTLAREDGLAKSNYFKFISAEAISFIIFILGNLGTRFFALLSLIKIKTILKKEEYLFLFIFSSISFIIPVLFIQAGNPWNTIQFLYYFLYVASLTSGLVLSKIILKLNKFVSIPLVLLVFIVTPINSWATANSYLINKPHALINSEELEALKFLKNQEDGVVLTFPYDENLKRRLEEPWPLYIYDSTAYVSALSQKKAFLEDESQNQILLTDYKKRLVSSKDFFILPEDKAKSFLKDNKIKYIYLPKQFQVRANEQTLGVKNIFENDEVIIYTLN